MSKTDKTRPWHVKMAEHPHEVHNHTNGVCEIKGKKPSRDLTSARDGACYFGPMYWRREFHCGCPICGYDPGGFMKRKERRAGKREARNYELAG